MYVSISHNLFCSYNNISLPKMFSKQIVILIAHSATMYIDDVLLLHNSWFGDYFDGICPIELVKQGNYRYS
jgi:hypothetical protein